MMKIAPPVFFFNTNQFEWCRCFIGTEWKPTTYLPDRISKMFTFSFTLVFHASITSQIYNTCWAFQYANASLRSYLIWVNDWNMIVCPLKFKFKRIYIHVLPFSCFWNFAMTQINLAQTCRKFFVLINFWQWNTTGRPNDVYTHRSRLDLRNHRIPSGNKTIYRQFGTKILFNRLITKYDGY